MSLQEKRSSSNATREKRSAGTQSSSTIQRGPLFSMMDAVIRGDRRVKWAHIIQYLEANTYTDHKHQVPLSFESPLPPFCHAGKDLARELAPCPKSGDSLLRRAVLGGGPQRVVACLCHLAPKALTIKDSKGRVLLHLATRVPVSPISEAVLQLLLQAHPTSVIVRDSYGRTPLHWLLWYHCADRDPGIVADFCRLLSKQKFHDLPSNLAETVVQDRNFALPAVPRPQTTKGASGGDSAKSKIPPTAAILPDAVYGCVPLHYAVFNGASLEVLRVLLHAYPLSKHVTDRYGRTAAHWYLGAGQVVFGNTTNNTGLLHISGEQPNPNAPPWHRTMVDPEKLQCFLSSRVARTMDGMGRNPLHWACFTLAYAMYYSSDDSPTISTKEKVDGDILPHLEALQSSIPMLQMLMDAHTNQILGTDEYGQTPLMVLLDTLRALQVQDRNPLPLPNPMDGGFLDSKVTTSRIAIELSPVLLRMLTQHPDVGRAAAELNGNTSGRNGRHGDSGHPQLLYPAAMEDSMGRLPLHVAVSIGCGIHTLSVLIQAHPTGLVHTTDSYQSPLHLALSNPLVTPYWTAAALNILLQTYSAGPSTGHNQGSAVVDGRLALKMEDLNGVYPIHFAAQNNACYRVLEALLQAYPAVGLQIRHDTQDLAFFNLMPNHIFADEDCANARSNSKSADLMHELLRGQQSSQSPVSNPRPVSSRTNMFKDALPLLKQKLQLFLPFLLQVSSTSNSSILQRTDSRHHMLILHVAILFQAATYPQLAKLLKVCPDSAKHICKCLQELPPPRDQLTNEGGNPTEQTTDPAPEWTVLDLHEAVQPHWLGESMEEWHHIRQLLFAHYPDVASHRRRHELLSQCIGIVIQEVAYRPKMTEDEYRPDDDPTLHSSFHWHAMKRAEEEEKKTPGLEISHSLPAIESFVRQSLNIRQPPLPTVPAPRPPGTRKKGAPKIDVAKPQRQEQQPKQKKKSMLASVREMTERRSSQKHCKSRSKYDDDDAGYDVNRSEGEHEDDHSFDTMSTFSQRDEDSSFSGDDDDEDSFTTDNYTDTEGETDHPLSTDTSCSTNNPSRTFSSEADSRECSPRSKGADERRLKLRLNSNSEGKGDADAFDRAMRRDLSASESMEEKKDEHDPGSGSRAKGLSTKNSDLSRSKKNARNKHHFAERPSYMSEVGMRIWTFFALYCDVHNPNDTYVEQISLIFGEIPFTKVEDLVQLPLPSYAVDYLALDTIFVSNGDIQAFRDVASPKCRELIHKTCFFVGMYEFTLHNDSKQATGIENIKNGNVGNEPSLVYCRPDDRHSFAVRAVEWAFTTQEATDAAKTPGISEEEIWQTGVMPAETGVTFRSRRKPVIITFTQDKAEYENEYACRSALAKEQDDVAEMLAHYNATQQDRQVDRTYRTDIHDDRFNRLSVGRNRVFLLENYPYAFVYHAAYSLDNIFSTFGGLESTEDVKRLCNEVGQALKCIHSRNIMHGNLSMQNIVQEHITGGSSLGRWKLCNFSFGSHYVPGKQPQLLGRISLDGRPLFATATLPPEMFVQLSEMELQAYERYWMIVEKKFFVNVDRSAIDPIVDPNTGDTFVPRCHFTPPPDSTEQLPVLPYNLVVASSSTDYWAFGLLIIEVCTGRPLFALEPRNGRLLEFRRHAKWDNKVAASLIYSTVKDPVQQDLLLLLLSPISKRAGLTMQKVLSHPFFSSHQSSSTVKNMIETRRRDTVAHKRLLQKRLHETSENGWLSERTTRLDCWDFAVLTKFQESPASIVGEMKNRMDDTLSFPISIIALPYQLDLNEKSQRVPDNREKAIAHGTSLLHLLKTCLFASELGEVIESSQVSAPGGKNRKVSISKLLSRLTLPKEHFSEAMYKFSELVSHHVESFRDDPRFVIKKIVIGALENYFEVFDEGDAWLYLVDEFNYLPLIGGFWALDSVHREELLRRSVLSTVLTCLCAWRSDRQQIVGFTKLLSEASHVEIPRQWSDASRGLSNTEFDSDQIIAEISVLQDALSDMTQNRHSLGDDDWAYLRDYISTLDPKRRLGDLYRVMVSSNIGLWTTRRQSQRLESQCKKFSILDALKRYTGAGAAAPPVDP